MVHRVLTKDRVLAKGRAARNPPRMPAIVLAVTLAQAQQARAPAGRYFLFLRWIRVLFSSLRCFFFAMRLRRFLMTEPMRPPLPGRLR